MELSLFAQIGKSGLDPEKAASFTNELVIPHLMNTAEKIVLDFQGIHNANSSFVNALFLNLIMKFGPEIVKSRIVVVNCRSKIADIVEAGLEFSIDRSIELLVVK